MNYKEVIESKYNREAWQQLLHDIFRNKVSFWNRPSAVHVNSRLAKEALNLGKISLADGEAIAIYEVELTEKLTLSAIGVESVICLLLTGAIWVMQVLLCFATERMKAYSAFRM